LILIVDDHLDTGTALARLLKKCGHEAVAVGSGAAALEMLEGMRPTVIVLDMMMPGMHGLEVLRRVRDDARVKDVPVLVYSADFSLDTANRARDLGAQEFIVKGTVPWDALCDAILKYNAA
jgi:chemosensory pili system protein ChpA (sensor histidine kinase/response regulator)